ncbi:MAG: hypothetical protein PHD51_01485 [Patescibacteria group bacterium]|nr:hypothetical protein [Patescibacteria group bacterium]MDD5490466.1 hypothetical protein [Patescibacteria group bacterium]
MRKDLKTKVTLVKHGSYSSESKYDITQHKYGCADCEEVPQGYAELLEIKNPPAGREGAVIHICIDGAGSRIFAFRTIAEARAAWELKCHELLKKDINFKGVKGFAKSIKYTRKEPWFYQN